MIENIIDKRNLYFAWEKLKKALVPGDIWFDEIDLASFEANLENEFDSIINDIKESKYTTSLMQPIGYPKAKKENDLETRQTFYLSIRDQLVWIAVVNIIGPELDFKMPFWSFGNRLFRSVWFEEGKEKKELKIGMYRHSSGFIYRKWNQSWPRYRRQISVTTKVMAFNKLFKENKKKFKDTFINDEQEGIELNQNINLPEELENKYWAKEYWTKELSGNTYWASIDFKKFYPSIQVNSLLENYKKYYPEHKQSPILLKLISNLLEFKIDYSGWTDEQLKEINLEDRNEIYKNLPTGLLVAGFLANLALLEVDNYVNKEIISRNNIAHFRFVDDHVILSDNFNDLVDWIKKYEEILNSIQDGIKINPDKTEPEFLKEFLVEESPENKKKAEESTLLDPIYPKPLMTQTLAKVSNISKTEFDLLDEQEEDSLIADLQHLLLSEFPEHELRKDTRISFAATMLSRLVPKKIEEIGEIYLLNDLIYKSELEETKLKNEIKELKEDSSKCIELNKKIAENAILLKENKSKLKEEKKKITESQKKLRGSIYQLLNKSVKENHQKVRLWSRLIEYSFNTGYNCAKDIFRTINELKDKECSRLSSEFLYSLILTILAHKLIDAVNIITKEKHSHNKKGNALEFIKSCSDDELNNEISLLNNKDNKSYLKKSISLFKFSLGSVLFLLNRNEQDSDKKKVWDLINKHDLIDWKNIDFNTWIQKHDYAPENMIWWLLKKTTMPLDLEPNIFWWKSIETLNLESHNSWAIIAQHPSSIPNKIQAEIYNYPQNTSKYFNCEGWKYDLLNSKNKINNDKNQINLRDWVDWMQSQSSQIKNSEMHFDPRLSEWTALNIILKILCHFEKPNDPFYSFFNGLGNLSSVHPSNYLIPLDWTDDSEYGWEDWKSKIEASEIKINDYSINDFRYTPNDSIFETNEEKIVFGLANILLGLLCKDFRMPYIWNVFGQQQSYLYLASKKIEATSLSSYTYGIIEACFSLRNIDSVFNKTYQENIINTPGVSDDSIKDMPIINSFYSLQKELMKSLKILESYQINVQDNLPRQLIPINLLQYSRPNNILNTDNNENINNIE